MKRILIAWELGGGLGHLMRAAAFTRAWAAQGVRTAVCLAELADSPWASWAADAWIFQSPLGSRKPPNFAGPANFGELLYGCGYHDGNQLSALVTAWNHLLEMLEPQLLLADHAPAAQLAARIYGIPTVRVGSGFFAPPPGLTTPRYRTWEPASVERMQASEARVLANINAILVACGVAPADSLAAALRPDLDLLLGWPETDCYAGSRASGSVTYIGHERAGAAGARPSWPESTVPGSRRIVAYLKGDYQGIEVVMRGLRAGHSTLAYVSNCAESQAQRWSSDQLRISPTPLDLKACAAECDVAICHAGAGTLPVLLEAGKPVLMLPYQAEQMINAKQIEALGAGLALDPAQAASGFASSLRRFLADERPAAAARMLAVRWAGGDDAVTTGVRTIGQWMATR